MTDNTQGYIEHPNGDVTMPSGRTFSKKDFDEREARRAKDQRPATRAELASSEKALLQAVASVLKKERQVTRDEIAEALKDLSGLETLRGAARLIADGNAEAITRALEPSLNRKAVVIDGTPPDWLQGMFQ